MKKPRPQEWAQFVAGSIDRPIVIPVKLRHRGRVVTRHYRLSLQSGEIKVERRQYCCWRYYTTLPLHYLRRSLPPEGASSRTYKLWVHLRQRFAAELTLFEREEAVRLAEGSSMLTPRTFGEEHLRTENEQSGFFKVGEGSRCIVFIRELVWQDVVLTVVFCDPRHSLYALYERWFQDHYSNPEILLGRRYPTGSFEYRFLAWLRIEVGSTRPFQFLPRPASRSWSGMEQRLSC